MNNKLLSNLLKWEYKIKLTLSFTTYLQWHAIEIFIELIFEYVVFS